MQHRKSLLSSTFLILCVRRMPTVSVYRVKTGVDVVSSMDRFSLGPFDMTRIGTFVALDYSTTSSPTQCHVINALIISLFALPMAKEDAVPCMDNA